MKSNYIHAPVSFHGPLMLTPREIFSNPALLEDGILMDEQAWSAYTLARLTASGKGWGFFDSRDGIRIPETSLFECVQLDRRKAQESGFPIPSAVQLMREGISDGLSAITPGKGNRARRRAAVLGMQSHNRLWMHLNIA